VAVAAVVLAALATFAWQWQRPEPRTGTADSFWYTRSAVQFTGTPQARATEDAGRAYCAQLQRSHRLGHGPDCVRYAPDGVSPRYRAIFTSRPGYPLAAAPAVAALGVATGLAVTAGAFFVLAALAGYGALRASGIGRAGSAVGAALLGVLPDGYWNSRLLAEGPAAAGLLAAVGCAVLLVRRPGRAAGRAAGWAPAAGLALALAWMFAVQPAHGAAAGLALAATAGGVALQHRVRGHPGVRPWAWAAAVAGTVVVAWWLLGAALGLPSLTETVQDLATRHFRTPDVADPLPYLLRRTGALWWHLSPGRSLALALVVLACAVLVRRLRGAGLLWTSAALSAVAVVSAHPLASEYPRLIATTWIAVAAAAAVLVDLTWTAAAARRGRGAGGGPGDGAAAATGSPVPPP